MATLSPPEWTPALRWGRYESHFKCFINCEEQSHKTVSTDLQLLKRKENRSTFEKGTNRKAPKPLRIATPNILVLWVGCVIFFTLSYSQRERRERGGEREREREGERERERERRERGGGERGEREEREAGRQADRQAGATDRQTETERDREAETDRKTETQRQRD